MLVYILSIVDEIHRVFSVLLVLSGIITGITVVVSVFTGGFYLDDSDETPSPAKESVIKLFKYSIRCIGICLLISTISALVPTRKSIIEGYLMVEGSKYANKESIDSLLENLDSKFNTLVDKIPDPTTKTSSNDTN